MTAGPPTTRTPGLRQLAPGLLRTLRAEEFWIKATAPAALVIAMIAFSIISPNFLTRTNIEGTLADATIPILLALGMTYAVSLAGIDLSLAANVALCSVVIGMASRAGMPLALACLFAVVTGLAIGALNGFFVGKVRIPDMIVTLGTMGIVQGASLIISRGLPIQISSPAFTTIGTDGIGWLRFNFLIAIGIAALLHVSMRNMRFGTHLLAVGDSVEASRAMGLRVARIKLAGYMVCGALGGIAAIFLCVYIGSSQPATNTSYVMKAVAATVLGGTNLFGGRATVHGPVLGAILLTVVQNGLTLSGVEAYYEPAVVGVVVLAAATLMRGRR